MHAILRHIPLVALAAALLGGTLAPAIAQAAPPQAAPQRAQLTTVQWSPNPFKRQIAAGRQFFVFTHFYTPTTIKYPAFSIHFNGGIYANPATFSLHKVVRGWNDLAFAVVVPARVRASRYAYKGTGYLLRGEGRGDYDRVGRPFYVFVRVTRAGHPGPHPQAPIIRWQPANSLGAIAVQRGQTVTETVSFTSNVALTNVHILRDLGDYARDHGVRVRISPTTPSVLANVAPGVAVPVIFTISAGPQTPLGGYPADLHVDAAVKDDGRVLRRPYDLDFRIAVRRDAAVIYWQPTNQLGTVTVQRGQTVTETGTFSSSVNLSDASVKALLAVGEDRREASRVRLAVISPNPAAPINVTAGAPVSVIFTVQALASAPLRSYPAIAYVVGTEPGGPRATLHYGLHFTVRVTGDTPVIHWQPTNQLGALTVHRGQTITETATFSSDVTLSNAEIVRALSDNARDHGVAITVLSLATPANITQGAPVTVMFTISAAPGARIAGYPAALYVKASLFGGPAVALHYGLHFTIDVDAAPATTVGWGAGGNNVAYNVSSGAVVTETATFTTSADVSNARLRLVYGQRLKGVRVTVAPLASTTIAANTPTTVSIIITTSPKAAGIFGGDVFLIAQPASATAPRLLHYGLHFTGAVQ